MSFANGMFVIDALGLTITIMDMVVVLFALILAIVGAVKGFVKVFFKFFGAIIVIVGAVLLAKTVGGWLDPLFGGFIRGPAENWVAGIDSQGGLPVATVAYDWADASIRADMLPMLLSRLGIPATLSGLISSTGILNGMFEGFGEAALIDVLPNALTSIAMTVIAFLLLIIALAIAIYFVRKIVEKIASFSLFGWLNRILGLVIGLAQAYLLISVAFTILGFFPSTGILSVVYQQIDASIVSKWLVEHNWISSWLITTIFPH